MTREELLAMMRSGQLGDLQSPGGPAPARRPAARPAARGRARRGPPRRRGPAGPAPRPGAPRPGCRPGGRRRPPPPDDRSKRKRTQGQEPAGSARPPTAPAAAPAATSGPTERRVTSPVPAAPSWPTRRTTRRDPLRQPESHAAASGSAVAPPRKSHAEIEPPITVRSLSEAIGVKANDLIRKLMST